MQFAKAAILLAPESLLKLLPKRNELPPRVAQGGFFLIQLVIIVILERSREPIYEINKFKLQA